MHENTPYRAFKKVGVHSSVHYRRSRSILFPRDPLVPLQPSWFPRIPALLESLQAETAPGEFTRRDVEQLFGVRRRRAILLLHRFEAFRRGPDLVARRDSVIAYLQRQWSTDAAEQAALQDRQVSDALAEARRALVLPSIPLPPPKRLSAITFAGLPPGIELTREELSVTFSSAQDLVEKLFTLAQAFANDYESLDDALNDRPSQEGPEEALHF